MSAVALNTTYVFRFYKCEGDNCGLVFSVEKKAKNEPNCPDCGNQFFSHITDRCIQM